MEDPLITYLHDHLAASRFAIELLEKLVSEFSGEPTGEVARDLLGEIRSDRRTLDTLVEKVGKATLGIHDALGWIAERMSRVKLRHDDPFGMGVFESFETISLGILGKRALWETLRTRENFDSRVAGFDYPNLIARSEQQFEKANRYRLRLVPSALGQEALTASHK